MKVLFLGAGASKDAGYPLTLELFKSLDTYFDQKTKIIPYYNFWKSMKTIQSRSRGRLGIILKSLNPEIVLSLPDIFRAALPESEGKAITSYMAAAEIGKEQIAQKSIEKFRRLQLIQDVTEINHLFTKIIDHYFSMKSCQDSERTLPKYFNKMLQNKDCVITTNWDTLSERILMDENLWFPSDGYGFSVPLIENYKHLSAKKTTQPVKLPTSKVKVYKLHGSIGWHSSLENKFYLQYSSYLQYLQPNDYDLKDSNEPDFYMGSDHLLICPSYLKQLDNKLILQIWDQAQEALYQATEVTFVGYSLPLADIAIRALIRPLRSNNSKIKVVIAPKDQFSKERWFAYFSDKKDVEFIEEKASSFFK